MTSPFVDSKLERVQPQISFIVTGFGPFHNVSKNPTTIIIHRLMSYLAQKAENMDQIELEDATSANVDWKSLSSNCTVQIYETAAEHVRNQLDSLYVERMSVQNKNSGTQHQSVILHLGVDYKGSKFKLERCGYNDATFRVPDEYGYQPKKECILSGRSFGECKTTTLNVNKICKDLQDCRGFGDSVGISGDAGRFVCNYTYYYSLNKSETYNENMNNETLQDHDYSPHHNVHTMFVHVPSFDVIHEEQQLHFISQLMDSIKKSLLSPTKKKKKKKVEK